jgi:hypothetical protein
LYDHDTDPYEYVNLARGAEKAGQLSTMKKLLSEGWKGAIRN